jgi:hypothetical protein
MRANASRRGEADDATWHTASASVQAEGMSGEVGSGCEAPSPYEQTRMPRSGQRLDVAHNERMKEAARER